MSTQLPAITTSTAEFCPRFVVLGATGAGKSTVLNRLSTALNQKRQKIFVEGAGAASETQLPQEYRGHFFGNKSRPCYFVDMPGLNDSGGAHVDTTHIQNAGLFLMKRPDPVAHVFILVVNAQSPRMSASIRNMLKTFNAVFDPDGTGNFIDYICVVFTKVNFHDMMHEDDSDDEEVAVSPDRFNEKKREQIDALAADWAKNLAAVLGHPGDQGKIKALTGRCLLTDNRISKSRLKKLTEYGYNMQLKLSQIYLQAQYVERQPFQLAKIDSSVKSEAHKLEVAVDEEKQKREEAEKEQLRIKEEAKAREEKLRQEAELREQRMEASAKARENNLKQEMEADRIKAEERLRKMKEESDMKMEKLRKRTELLASGGREVDMGNDNKAMHKLKTLMKNSNSTATALKEFMKRERLTPIDRPYWEDLRGHVVGAGFAGALSIGLLTAPVVNAKTPKYGLDHMNFPSVLEWAKTNRYSCVSMLTQWDYDE